MFRRAAFALFLFTACAHAPAGSTSATPSFLWRATKPGQPGTVHLLGSVHFRAADRKLDRSITDGVTKADHLVFEVDEKGSEGAAAAWIAANGMYEGEPNLEDALSPETMKRLEAVLGDPKQPGSLPRDRLVAMRPWLVTMLVPAVVMARNGIDSDTGIDKVVRRFGASEPTKKRELHFLETVQGQLEMLKSLEELDAETLVAETLRGSENGEVLKLIDLYEAGDVAGLAALVQLPPEASPKEVAIYRRTITDRNHVMHDGIRPFFERPGTTFVTVGAAHLVGEEGLVALLEADGAELEPIPRAGPAADEVLAVMEPKPETYRSEDDGFEIDTPYNVLRMNEGGSPSHVMSLGGASFLMISSAALPEGLDPPYEAKAHAAKMVIQQVDVADLNVEKQTIAGLEAAVASGTKEGKHVVVRAVAVPGRVYTMMTMTKLGDTRVLEKVDAILATFRPVAP